MKGMLQVYTGNGKGKTTAALGLALRAAGAGKKVFIAQFAKEIESSEENTIKLFGEDIVLKKFGRESFIKDNPTAEDIASARKGFDEVKAVLKSGQFDLVILDEANIAVHFKLIGIDELLEAIDHRDEHVEVVVTGRKADKKLIEKADLVTEMKEIKHYYSKGIPARKGIEY